jgi:hypothetical protein
VHSKVTHVLPLLILLTTESARAESDNADPRCARAQKVPFPAGDRPSDAQKAALKGCDAEDLYYGITGPTDLVKARLCAYAQIDSGDETDFGGTAILMMIYATGAGTKRNPALAIRLACEVDGAPAEVEGRLAHLETLERQPSGHLTFDLCDDITSGYMMGACAGHDQRFKQAKRQRRWKGRLDAWTPPERQAFARLRASADAFFRARSMGEVDLSGTARDMFIVEEEERLEGGLVAVVDRLEAKKLPVATAADYQAADKELNAAYAAVMKSDAGGGTVTKADIKKAERAWLRYRDEWVRFAHVKYPAVSPEAIKTWLTRQRVTQLVGSDAGDP